MKRTIRLLLFGLIIFCGPLGADISINVIGTVFRTISASDLQGGAGTDLKTSYESAPPDISINITGTTGPSDNWEVDVKKIDTGWHDSFHLYIKRSSPGSGSGTISGGDVYQEVTGTDQAFFNGSGDRSDINIQFELSGVSVQIPPANYLTTVYYTIIDTF
jgi:hypothetical protein